MGVALHAAFLVLPGGLLPSSTDCLVRVVASDAGEYAHPSRLRFCRLITVSAQGVRILGRVPGSHACGILRATTRMTAGADKVLVCGVASPDAAVARSFSEDVAARRKEQRFDVLVVDVGDGSEVAGFTRDAEGYSILGLDQFVCLEGDGIDKRFDVPCVQRLALRQL